MEKLNKFQIQLSKKPTQQWLDDNKFFYDKAISDKETTYFKHRFPVYKYGTDIILDCELLLNYEESVININVYDGSGTVKALYAPYYYVKYGNYDIILKKINDSIERELKRLGITEKVENIA